MSQTNGSPPQFRPSNFALATPDGELESTSTQETQSPPRLLVTCPHCKTTLSVRRIYIGDGVRCKRCRQKFLVPERIGTEPTPIYDGLASGEPGQSSATESNAPSDVTSTAGRSLVDQLARFVASFDQLQSELGQLQADHDGMRVERDNIRDALKKANDELTSIHAALGPIAPDEVQSLASEHESLCAELRVLRNKYESVLTDLSDRECSITRLEETLCELAHLQGERDALSEQVKANELELGAVRAERDALTTNLSKERAANVETHSELGLLTQQLTQAERNASIMREESARLEGQLDLSKRDLGSVQVALARTSDERQKMLATAQELTKAVDERDRNIALQRDEFDAELKRSRELLDSAERSHVAAVDSLKSEFASLDAKHQKLIHEHRIVESLCADRQARNTELTIAQAALECEYRQRLEAQEAERQKLTQEFLELRANSEETDRLIEELISTALNIPTVPVATAQELATAGIQPEASMYGDPESRRLDGATEEMLASIGIDVRF